MTVKYYTICGTFPLTGKTIKAGKHSKHKPYIYRQSLIVYMYGSIFVMLFFFFRIAVFLNNLFMTDNGTYILLTSWEILIVNKSGYEPLNLEKTIIKGCYEALLIEELLVM